MLDRFRKAKAQEIARLQQLKQAGAMPAPWPGVRPGFAAALMGPDCAIIAEYKRASPSKGAINLEISPAQCAREYAAAGADALSVLTEAVYFKGSLDYLFAMRSAQSGPEARLPLLRKDFIFQPLQVEMTAATPASALLLIARMLDREQLEALIRLAASFGLECVVEIFDEADFELAASAGAGLIQVNNRDLASLQTDLNRSFKLAHLKQSGQVWISASGITRPTDLQALHAAGYDAVLVGSSLMAGKSPGQALHQLRGCNA